MKIVRLSTLLLIAITISNVALGQIGPKIFGIDEAVKRVIDTYPSIDQSEEAIKRAEYNIRMAQAAFYPMISGTAGYQWMEPKTVITFDRFTFDMSENNIYYASVGLRQLICGFGQSLPRVHAAKIKHEIAQYQKEELLQSLTLNTINLYYTVCFTRQAMQIKQEELFEHDEMLRQMELMMESGSSTNFDLLNTRVARHVVVSHMTGLEANLKSLQVQLSELVDSTITENIPLESQFD